MSGIKERGVGGERRLLVPDRLDEVVPRAVAATHADGQLDIDIPESLALITEDARLLERALANLIDNAVIHSPPGKVVRVDAGQHEHHVTLRIIDRGPGIRE